MATLAPSGRIDTADVEMEIARLRGRWRGLDRPAISDGLDEMLDAEALAGLDPFDRAQLAAVVRTCRDSRNLSDAGRRLFAVSRRGRRSTNDADRLRKYLLRIGLKFEDIAG